MKRNYLLTTVLSALLAWSSATAASVAGRPKGPIPQTQPNIVHILTDDLGWQDVACYYRSVRGKESLIETPNMDRIAKNGMLFMQAYSPSPVCAPSRAAYMAGQSTLKAGVLHVLGGTPSRPRTPTFKYIDPIYTARLSLETPTIATLLKDAGYITAHIQKFHFGGVNHGFPGPLDYGFDFSWTTGPGMRYNDPDLWDPNDKKRADYQGIWAPLKPDRLSNFPSSHDPEAPYSLDADDRPYDSVVDLSIRWMDKVKGQGKPFFINFCPSFVHGPIGSRDRKRLELYCEKMGFPFPTEPGRVTDKQKGQVNPYYAAMIDSADWQVGQILTFLETTDDPRNPGHKLIDNTYIMVSSDNGGSTHGGTPTGSEACADNTPLRAGKKSAYEGGVRIPFIIQGPGIQADSINNTPINLLDMLPTYVAMSGEKPKRELDIDGCNVLPLMLGQDNTVKFADGSVRDTMFFSFPIEQFANSVIRKGGWKLLWNHVPEMNGFEEVQLYRLYNLDGSVCDLGEAKNVADTNPDRRDAMLKELKAWLKANNAILPYKNAHLAGAKLAGSEQVPAVIHTGIRDDVVTVRVETEVGKAKIVEALLFYTTNGSGELRDHKNYEEWFIASATLHADGAEAFAPPGMTHGIFYLRDANGFVVNSELLPARITPGSDIWAKGSEFIENVYGYRPGLISLINTGLSAVQSATQSGQNTARLSAAIEAAKAVAQTPVDEKSYARSMSSLRHAIQSLDVSEAKLPVLNQFKMKKWSTPEQGAISSRGDNGPHEPAQNAFDGNPKTKWLDFSPQDSWIQYAYVAPKAVTGYAITSADEPAARDPMDWQLLGSNDGKTWAMLDTRSGEQWLKRYEKRSFKLSNQTACKFYRMKISAVRDVAQANSVQLAEVEFLTAQSTSASGGKARFVSNLDAGKPQTVVTFGTSLTAVGAWVDQLRTVIEQQYPGQAKVINGAQGGANSDWGRGALDEKVLKHNPDTVLIEFSVNDAVARRKTSVAHARGNLENMIKRIIKQNSDCEIILQVMNPPVGHTKTQRPNLLAYNQMVRDVAKERGFQLIDHYPVWEKLLNDDPLKFLFYVPDTIHPVREGALQVITPTMLHALGLKPGKPELSEDAPCWKYLSRGLMDKDKDRVITHEEFNNYWKKLFTNNDANLDGELSADEFGPQVLFDALDADQDRQVTLDEFLKVYAPHFTRFE